ncbi:MAG: DNA mismatch repair protein MutS [Acidobacteriota bacterium]
MDQLSPMMRQYHQIKKKYSGALLFFRLGDFYEMFFDDAVVASRELEITLTSRNRDRAGVPIPMCGVPYHAAEGYLAKLLRKGYKVAICEQTENPADAVGIVQRQVVRVLTPGTATDSLTLEPGENNYLVSVFFSQTAVALAALDISTGQFWVTQITDATGEALAEELSHYGPREILVAEGQRNRLDAVSLQHTLGGVVRTVQSDWIYSIDDARRLLEEHFHVAALDGLGLAPVPLGISAAAGLLSYVRETQQTDPRHILSLRVYRLDEFLKIDEATVANLELVEATDGSRRQTLLGLLDNTATAMGARLLRYWILRPLTDLAQIQARLDAVGELARSAVLRERLARPLRTIHDLERLLSKVTLNTAGPRDLASLRETFLALPAVRASLEPFTASRITQLGSQLDPMEDCAELLVRAIAENPPVALADGGVIRSGYSAELDDLRAVERDGKSYIAALEARERTRTGIASLKVKYNQVFGYFIEITRANLSHVPADFTRKQTLVNAERFITPELKEYEEKVLTAGERIGELERHLFIETRQRLADQGARIQTVARVLAELDVLLALADAATRYRYARPTLDNSDQLEIKAGRHPVLEHGDPANFVPNDLCSNTTTHQMIILTGPNMGGKSTYLRQNALMVVMAQMGSFVPAEEAHIGLVDQVFTRVGASDNIARGRSTFMVEMIETANILNTATHRSLVLLDEVGRGTATFDGLSIAWSVAEYLHNTPERKARTIFATHYHELTKLEKIYDGVKNFCVLVREGPDGILFFHKVMEGVADKSYGIEVARLAGLPVALLERARDILSRLERKEIDLAGKSHTRSTEEVTDEIQKTLF